MTLEEDDAWLAEETRQAGPCPRCGREAGRPILFGMPDSEHYYRWADRAVFAGCCLPEVMHRWSCGHCEHEWGERRAEPVEPLRSVFDGL